MRSRCFYPPLSVGCEPANNRPKRNRFVQTVQGKWFTFPELAHGTAKQINMIIIGPVIIIFVQAVQNEAESVVRHEGEMVEPDGSSGSGNGFLAECKKCGWAKPYATRAKAKQALGAHSRFCPGAKWNVSPFARPFR